jgi:hypothetical protein
LVEIKTPHTQLLGKEFCDGVFLASGDLVGSVAQVLDQRYQFEKKIAQIKDTSDFASLSPVTDPLKDKSPKKCINALMAGPWIH